MKRVSFAYRKYEKISSLVSRILKTLSRQKEKNKQTKKGTCPRSYFVTFSITLYQYYTAISINRTRPPQTNLSAVVSC